MDTRERRRQKKTRDTGGYRRIQEVCKKGKSVERKGCKKERATGRERDKSKMTGVIQGDTDEYQREKKPRNQGYKQIRRMQEVCKKEKSVKRRVCKKEKAATRERQVKNDRGDTSRYR